MEAFTLLKKPSVYIKLLAAVNLGDSNKLYQFQLTLNNQVLKTDVRAGSRQLLGESIEFNIENTEQVVTIACFSVPEEIENEEEQTYVASMGSTFQPSLDKQKQEIKMQRNESEKKIEHLIQHNLRASQQTSDYYLTSRAILETTSQRNRKMRLVLCQNVKYSIWMNSDLDRNSKNEANQKQFTSFQIKIRRNDGQEWFTNTRYSELKSLYKSLTKQNKQLAKLEFPNKNYFN